MCSLAKAAPALFSDGKLYSQIKDPQHLGRKVLHEFVKGRRTARERAAHPHIGTFKLVKVVERFRANRSLRWAARSALSSA